jgi:Flp pilus assembly protein TadD
MISTLAAAFAEAGRFPEAIQASRKALELARHDSEAGLVKQLEARMRLYQASQPYHVDEGGPN